MDKHSAINLALKVFGENYPSNFRGSDFQDTYSIKFNRVECSFTISWTVILDSSKEKYDVILFLNGTSPIVWKEIVKTEIVREMVSK